MIEAEASQDCLACGAEQGTVGASPEPCGVCGFVWLGNAPVQDYDYEEGYDEEVSYNSRSRGEILAHYRAAPNTAWALLRLEELLRKGSARSLLEIGCSQGAFLALARELGLHVRGIELSMASVAFARREFAFAAELEEGPWRSRREGEPLADVACAFEVMEHSRNPLEFLSMMRSWLRPGGHLFLSVPNGRRLNVRLGRREPQDYPPHHFMYWTRDALRAAAERSGFTVVETRTSSLTHSGLLSALAPGISNRRATELRLVRPVGSREDRRPLSSGLRMIYPAATQIGKLAAGALNLIPELGARLMLMARLSK